MSVTFRIENAPESYHNLLDECPGLTKVDFANDSYVTWIDENPCQLRSDWPEVNVSQVTFSVLKQILGTAWDYSGQVPTSEIPTLLQRLLVLRNTLNRTSASFDEMSELTIERDSIFSSFINRTPYEEERVKRLLQALSDLFQKALKEKRSVLWS